jgi:hypothetical protein
MSETISDCPECQSVDSLSKRPSSFLLAEKEKDSKQTGQVVKRSIEEFREDLDCEKNKLKSKVYDPSE